MTTVEVRGTGDARAVEQLRRCADDGDAVAVAICADGHVGYSQPIGGVVAYRDYSSPSGVGYESCEEQRDSVAAERRAAAGCEDGVV